MDNIYPDSLILMAVLGCYERGADLHDIFSTADYLDHSIPTDAELTAGLTRLQSAGWIEERAGLYYPTPALLAAYDPAVKLRRFGAKQRAELEQLLRGF